MGLFISKDSEELTKELQSFCTKYAKSESISTEQEEITNTNLMIATVIMRLDDRCLVFNSVYTKNLGMSIRDDFEMTFDEAAVKLERVYIKDYMEESVLNDYLQNKYIYSLDVLKEFEIIEDIAITEEEDEEQNN
jgi:hypothetical protein